MLRASDVKNEARGRWERVFQDLAPDLAQAMAKAPAGRKPQHVTCPVHGGKHKDGFRLFRDWRETGGGVCNSCGTGKGWRGGIDLLMWLNGWDFKRTLEAVADVLGLSSSSPRPSPRPSPAERRAPVTDRHEEERREASARRIIKACQERSRPAGSRESGEV